MTSRPTQARELKLTRRAHAHARFVSRPTQARELKQLSPDACIIEVNVAPHAGA